MNDKYILDGHETRVEPDLIKWGQWFETADRHIAKTQIGDVQVSTMFLGLDHSFGGPVPILFETMIFGGPFDQDTDRYSTWDEAVAGHDAMVERAT